MRLPALLSALLCMAAPAAAEPLSFGESDGNGLWVSALFGVRTGAAYFGSDETRTGPAFGLSPEYLGIAGLSFGERRFTDDPRARDLGFGLRGSFRFIGERDAEDYDDLDGLDDVDATLEVGLGLVYTLPNAELFADVRYGLGGSDGWVGELGGDIIMRPTDRMTLRAGPRALFGSDNFTETYFGISASEAARSGLDAHDPEGGLVSTGVELSATYRLGERWWLEGGARYERFRGDAADSPIVEEGSDENTSLHIGLRRAFVFEF